MGQIGKPYTMEGFHRAAAAFLHIKGAFRMVQVCHPFGCHSKLLAAGLAGLAGLAGFAGLFWLLLQLWLFCLTCVVGFAIPLALCATSCLRLGLARVFIVLGCLITLVLANGFRYTLTTTVWSNDAGVDGSDEGTELNGDEKPARSSELSVQTLAGDSSVILVRIM